MSNSAPPAGDPSLRREPNLRRLRRATALVGALAALLLLWPVGVGSRWAWGEYQVVQSRARAPGVVVGSQARAGQRGRVFQHAVVRFETPSGGGVTFTDPAGSRQMEYRPGDGVVVAYDPASPGRAMIDSFGNRWVGVLLWGGAAAACLLVAILIGVKTIPGNLS